MREIKFRAWKHVNTPKMFNEVQGINFVGGIVHLGYRLSSDTVRTDKELLDNLILMQYTGLKDKNGTEIYEGDILLIQAGGYDSIISEVVWGGTEYPAFDLPKYDGYEMNAFSAIYHNDVKETLEVIGNIYENPELLEVD